MDPQKGAKLAARRAKGATALDSWEARWLDLNEALEAAGEAV
jgi:hypothetical protein